MSTFTERPVESGNCSAMFAAIDDGLLELIRLNVMMPEPDRMIATAIVSPSARPRPSIAPLMIPGAAEGQHRHADHLPARGAEGERRLLVQARASGRTPRARPP